MAALRCFSRSIFIKKYFNDLSVPILSQIHNRNLNYASIEYKEEKDPAPLFFNNDTQSLLRILTRPINEKVFRRRKIGTKNLSFSTQKFMTEDQLQEAFREAEKTKVELLQMPPVVKLRKPKDKVLSRDPALTGLEESTLIFTDITFGIRNSDRIIVVRDPDGTLREADWDVRDRMNQLYFPVEGKKLAKPKMFEDANLESLLQRKEYEFILDRTCLQFEPDSEDYQKVTSITYQHINDNNDFESLRSTRHFGSMSFFLIWNKMIDNLLMDLMESLHVDEANALLQLFSKIHGVDLKISESNEFECIEEYVRSYSNKKGSLELALQSLKERVKEMRELNKGIKKAHGLV